MTSPASKFTRIWRLGFEEERSDLALDEIAPLRRLPSSISVGLDARHISRSEINPSSGRSHREWRADTSRAPRDQVIDGLRREFASSLSQSSTCSELVEKPGKKLVLLPVELLKAGDVAHHRTAPTIPRSRGATAM